MKTQHIHILGICGTFMGGLAILAKEMGYRVTGSDKNVYPPMSTFLMENGIEIIPHFEPSQLEPAPDMTIVGNAMTRGNPCVEYLLEYRLPFTSGPQWLHDHLLYKRKVLAISGTHGKTTTTGMLSWILDQNGIDTGFLIGGISGNFGCSSRLGKSEFFVIEADEYDTAFFDKRSKFVHYNPYVAVINNLGFDHADIFEDLKAIQRQFHHMIRLVPQSGLVLSCFDEESVQDTLKMGCWANQSFIGKDWRAEPLTKESSHFAVYYQNKKQGEVHWKLVGKHNMENALMAIAAAHYVGIPINESCFALGSFINAKRRLEIKGKVGGVTIYDDFAHHPVEIKATLEALRSKVGGERILAVLEPRSNTMKMGFHKTELAESVKEADEVFFFQPTQISWSLEEVAKDCSKPCSVFEDLEALIQQLSENAKPEDHILIMSNGGFGGIYQKLLNQLAEKFKN